jgi:hypothetical protein
MRRSIGDKDWESLFVRGVGVLVGLRHPYIVSLIGFSMPTKDEPPRLATIFIDGMSLSDAIESKPDWWTDPVKSINYSLVLLFYFPSPCCFSDHPSRFGVNILDHRLPFSQDPA